MKRQKMHETSMQILPRLLMGRISPCVTPLAMPVGAAVIPRMLVCIDHSCRWLR